jgi:hypothetical protein
VGLAGFDSEQALVDTALRSGILLQFAGGKLPHYVLTELRGLFGIPDVIVARHIGHDSFHAVAFEMKISNWQHALMQAFRYRAFADRSYVCMDQKFVHRAVLHIDRFLAAGVGLLSVDTAGMISVHYDPPHEEPYSAAKRAKLAELIVETQLPLWAALAPRNLPVVPHKTPRLPSPRVGGVSEPGWCSCAIRQRARLSGCSVIFDWMSGQVERNVLRCMGRIPGPAYSCAVSLPGERVEA